MEFGKHLATGVSKQSHNYTARHLHGVGFIPLGDRDRDVHAFGVDVVEERDSIDAYAKFLDRKGV